MRVLLDNNVAVSAAINPAGTPGQLILRWQRGAFTWVTSEALLHELSDVFSRPALRRYFTWQDEETDDFHRSLVDGAEIVSPTQSITRIAADPDDNRVLEAAVEGGVEYIVTGDRDLLDLRTYEDIEIVTPAEFLAILAEARNP